MSDICCTGRFKLPSPSDLNLEFRREEFSECVADSATIDNWIEQAKEFYFIDDRERIVGMLKYILRIHPNLDDEGRDQYCKLMALFNYCYNFIPIGT